MYAMYVCIVCIYIYLYVHVCMHTPVFLISSYGPPLAQRASYVTLHSSFFGPDGAVILSLTALTLC